MKTVHLLPQEGHFYRANLHCHSTLSDGQLTPQQLRDAYRDAGYQVLCITDHELLIDHSDLNTPDMLLLTGCEISINDPASHDPLRSKCCHINLYSPRADYTKYVCFDPNAYNDHMRASLRAQDVPEESYRREYSPQGISEIVRLAHEAGFLCSYNHPTWSLETLEEYGGYRGFDMMEMVNYGCAIAGLDEYNGHAYDEMLRAGRRLACSATDDNHNAHPLQDPLSDSFGGWVMIKAPSLTYADIWQALRYGDFYACAGGPAIEELTLQDGAVHIACAGAREIHLINAGRAAGCAAAAAGELLTQAAFPLNGTEGYIRLELIGPDGRRTFTRAYFLDELGL